MVRLGLIVAALTASMIAAPVMAAKAAAKPAAVAPVATGDAAAGATVFKMKCMSCHTNAAGKPDSIGPNLFGIAGKKAGEGTYKFSDALKNSGLVFDAPTLDKFLTAPRTVVPGTRMMINVSDAKQRGDLVAYLAGLK